MKLISLALSALITIGFGNLPNGEKKSFNAASNHSTNSISTDYQHAYADFGLSKKVFTLAVAGFSKLATHLKSDSIVTIIDFDLPSTKKRLWVLNLKTKKVLHYTYVAHGRNSGQNEAVKFSNVPESNASSLGFYVTGKTYHGKHGLSLYLDGMENGINHKARERAIVIHGANYVSEQFIKRNGRLGRSLGCPALPSDVHTDIISTIANGSGLFIHKSDQRYYAQSTLIAEELAADLMP